MSHDSDAHFRTPKVGPLPCWTTILKTIGARCSTMHRVSVFLFTPAQIARHDRVLRTSNTSFLGIVFGKRSFLLVWRSPRGVIFHASAVSLSNFRMLTRGYRVGSSGCGLHKVPLISKIALAFAAASCCGISEVHLQLCSNFPWFRTCGCFLACTTMVCVFFHLSAEPSKLFLSAV